MYLKCQKTYLLHGRCHRRTYRDGKFCRWHEILQEFQQDHRAVNPWVWQSFMFGVYGSLSIAGLTLRMFSTTYDLVALLMAVYSIGLALKLFADAIMAKNYPLSLFAFWPQMLALG